MGGAATPGGTVTGTGEGESSVTLPRPAVAEEPGRGVVATGDAPDGDDRFGFVAGDGAEAERMVLVVVDERAVWLLGRGIGYRWGNESAVSTALLAVLHG